MYYKVYAESGTIGTLTVMNIKGILFFATMSMIGQIQAQELKTFVDKKGKIGYLDASGNEVIKSQYDGAYPFSNGVAIVTKAGKMGMIDTTGKVVLPISYTQISPWNNDLYLIKNGKGMGLADLTGKIVLPAKYSLVTPANCYGKALIALGGKVTTNDDKKQYLAKAKYGIINEKGDVLVTPTYPGLYEFACEGQGTTPYYEGKRLIYSYHCLRDTLVTDCEYLGFSKDGLKTDKSGIMDGNGKEIMKQGLYDVSMMPKGNMVRYYNLKKKETVCGYHNLETSKGFVATILKGAIGEIKNWSHGDFTGDVAPVNGTIWTFIDKTGNVIRSGYSSLIHCQELGLWAARNESGKWEVFNEQNENIDAISGHESIAFPEMKGDKEIFIVKKDGKYGAITITGKIVIPFEYEEAMGNRYDYVAVKKEGKWGMVTAENKQVIEPKYYTILLPSQRDCNDFWVMKSDSLYYHFNTTRNHLSSNGFRTVNNFKDGVAYVAPKNISVPDILVNKAQLFSQNSSNTKITDVSTADHIKSFGYLYNTNDEMVFEDPVTPLYIDEVRKKVIENGTKPMNASERKKILLDVTKQNRSYGLKETLSEQEWDY